MPSFRRTPESSLFKRFWTPVFAGVTGRENVIIFGDCYNSRFSYAGCTFVIARPSGHSPQRVIATDVSNRREEA